MIRDSLKNKDYFDNYLIERKESVNRRKRELDNNEIRVDFRHSVSYHMYHDSIRLIYAMYSRGDDIQEIKETFIKITLESYFTAYVEKGIDYDHFDPYLQLAPLMSTISFLTLFEIKGETLVKALEILKHAPKYQIINRYLSGLGLQRENISEEHKFEKAFSKLNEMFELSNEEIIKNKLINKYLKTWYNNETRVFGKDLHGDEYNGYYMYHGYWAFEVAAFVKLRGLDDSGFRDNIYYPKDLIV